MKKVVKNKKVNNPRPTRYGCPRVQECKNGVCSVDDSFKKMLEQRKAADVKVS